MKKLLSFFAALSMVSMSSLSVISCDNTAEIIKNKIDNAKSITIRGDNLSYDLNDYLTKKTIFNELNLTSFEQKYIINLKGSISSRKITFDISSNPNTSVEKYTASIKLNDSKIEATDNTKPSVQPDFNLANAKNIAILNNRQISISGASNSAQVSDDNLNLNTDKSYELIDNLSTPPSFVNFFGDYYYTVPSDDEYICLNKAEDYSIQKNEYTKFDDFTNFEKISLAKGYSKAMWVLSSNNHYYALETSKISSKIFDITNPKNIIELTSNLPHYENATTVYNDGKEIFVGTNTGLWKSTDDAKTWTCIEGTEKLHIKTIEATNDNKTIFFGTYHNGMWLLPNTTKPEPKQISTKIRNDIDVNDYSLFISNGNVYFGLKDNGFWSCDLEGNNIKQIVTKHILKNSDVKSIVKYYDGTLILLTDSAIVYYQE